MSNAYEFSIVISGRMLNLDGRMNEMESTLAQVQTDVAGVKMDVSEVKTAVAEGNTKVGQVKSELAAVKRGVEKVVKKSAFVPGWKYQGRGLFATRDDFIVSAELVQLEVLLRLCSLKVSDVFVSFQHLIIIME